MSATDVGASAGAVTTGTKRETLAGQQGRAGLLLALPSVALILVFFWGPVLYGLWLSLTDFDVYAIADPSTVRFVGLGNYLHAFSEPDFWNALRITLVYALVGAPVSVAVSLATALLVDAKTTRWKPFFRAVYFAPVVTTLVAVAIVFAILAWVIPGRAAHLAGRGLALSGSQIMGAAAGTTRFILFGSSVMRGVSSMLGRV